ncbi:Alpha/Beta hydrolase protein [Rhexocercosporidium sp. MPI-PUGE-AT-0058]|nr:Alpha/Beta hydrolase protein [Rhexocercosporidium sp. MPI-PUGE-AT-0058]
MMLYPSITNLLFASIATLTSAHPSPNTPILTPNEPSKPTSTPNISIPLFAELEELSRIVDISYCVGTTGISHPFLCASRCDEFPSFELVDTFNTGPLMSDSCGYIVLDHGTGRLGKGRIIVAFRGTYSIANTIVDLSTVPQEYVPYPGSPDNSSDAHQPARKERHRFSWRDFVPGRWRNRHRVVEEDEDVVQMEEKREEAKCTNCTVHTGFWTSWQNTRPFILPHIKAMHVKYPDYRVDLVGHSLGGAVAALAGLEFDSLGLTPTVTTFGEPKVGNAGLRNYIDATFKLPSEHDSHSKKGKLQSGRYRRVTHVDDPVPLLPLQEWGYRSHAGEHFISKAALQPAISDVRLCYGDEDTECMASAEVDESWFNHEAAADAAEIYNGAEGEEEFEHQTFLGGGDGNGGGDRVGVEKRWGIPIPARYKMWQLFFAHRDYFWRLGLCVPGGDPLDWGRDKYKFGDEGEDGELEREEL